MTMTIAWDDFARVEMRVGRIVRAEPFPEARAPSLKLWIDFGPELGVRKTGAGIAPNYDPSALTGRLIVAVTNFPPRQIGRFMSEVLILGLPDAAGEVVLLSPDRDVPLGGRVY